MKEPVSQEILYAYFENRATAHEKVLIKEWLKEKGNEEIFYHHLAIWEANHLQVIPDVKKALRNYSQFLSGEPIERSRDFTNDKVKKLSSHGIVKYLSIAASILLLMSVGFFFSKDYFFYDTYSTGYGMTKNILLQDGSEVTLNANSTLKVPKNLASSELREVWLQGEGFFAVAKRPDHVRFAVHSNNLNVEVLGTKFNVNNRHGKTEVVLNEGRVKLTSNNDEAHAIYMKPGDYVSLAQNDTTFRRLVVKPEKYNAWQSNKLTFEDTPLRVVAEKIEDYYGVKIEIENKDVADRQMTGTLPNNDLGIVLKSLSAAHHLKVYRENNRIILR